MTHADDDGLVCPPQARARARRDPAGRRRSPRSASACSTTASALEKELEAQTLRRRARARRSIDDRDLRGGDKVVAVDQEGRADPPRDRPARHRQGHACSWAAATRAPKEKAGDAARRVRREGRRRSSQEIQDALFERALAFRKEHTREIDTKDEFYAFFADPPKKKENDPTPIHGGFAMAHFNGDPALEAKIKDDLKVTVRCIPLEPRRARHVPVHGQAEQAARRLGEVVLTASRHELPRRQVPLDARPVHVRVRPLRRRMDQGRGRSYRCSRSAHRRSSSSRGNRARTTHVRACPECGTAMQTVKLGHVALDRCEPHGVWFDASELADAAQGSEALPRRPAAARGPAAQARQAAADRLIAPTSGSLHGGTRGALGSSCGPRRSLRLPTPPTAPRKQITTARYARHALAYVLNNWRRHREDFANGREIAAHLDPYSSGVSFDGWTITFAKHPDYNPLPVSPPQTRLLREDWKRFGRIDPHECPGPLW